MTDIDESGHVLDAGCWCDPLVQRACPECDGGVHGCWFCEGTGSVLANPDDQGPFVIVHREEGS